MGEMGMDKNNRILSVYTQLLQGQTVVKKDLAGQFGVNEKSIQRDLEAIRDFLDRQAVEQGYGSQLIYDVKEKGYRLEQSERMGLSDDEILAVSKILLDSRAFPKREMMSLLDRLILSHVPFENRRNVEKLLSNERFHYVELTHHRSFLDKLTPLGKAIRECRVIQISYEKMKGKAVVERKLEPLAVLFSEYYFYLVGFIEEINKEEAFENADDPFPTIYRIDRIRELKVTQERFKIPYADRFEEGELRKRVQFMYGGKLRKVRFRYVGESIEAVLDRLPTAKVLNEEDGEYTIEAEVFGKGIDMWVRSQGARIADYKVICEK